jgi:hypothetical protein
VKTAPFATGTKTATFPVTSEKLHTVREHIVQKCHALFGNAFRTFGFTDTFVVVRDVAVRKATKGDRQFVAVVLNLDVAEIRMRSWNSDGNSTPAAQPHPSVWEVAT